MLKHLAILIMACISSCGSIVFGQKITLNDSTFLDINLPDTSVLTTRVYPDVTIALAGDSSDDKKIKIIYNKPEFTLRGFIASDDPMEKFFVVASIVKLKKNSRVATVLIDKVQFDLQLFANYPLVFIKTEKQSNATTYIVTYANSPLLKFQ